NACATPKSSKPEFHLPIPPTNSIFHPEQEAALFLCLEDRYAGPHHLPPHTHPPPPRKKTLPRMPRIPHPPLRHPLRHQSPHPARLNPFPNPPIRPRRRPPRRHHHPPVRLLPRHLQHHQ